MVAIRKTVHIGRPGYRVTKQFDIDTMQRSLLFQADPYEVIAFKVPSYEIDRNHTQLGSSSSPQQGCAFHVKKEKYFTHWDPDMKVYTLQSMSCGFMIMHHRYTSKILKRK